MPSDCQTEGIGPIPLDNLPRQTWQAPAGRSTSWWRTTPWCVTPSCCHLPHRCHLPPPPPPPRLGSTRAPLQRSCENKKDWGPPSTSGVGRLAYPFPNPGQEDRTPRESNRAQRESPSPKLAGRRLEAEGSAGGELALRIRSRVALPWKGTPVQLAGSMVSSQTPQDVLTEQSGQEPAPHPP